MRAHMHASPQIRSRGFSIIELMVAATLSLLLLGGVLSLFASSRKTYESNERMARIQENGRFALEQIERDIRAAGYLGACQYQYEFSFTNTLFLNTSLAWNFQEPVHGFEATSATAWLPALDTLVSSVTTVGSAIKGNDVVSLRVPDRDGTPSTLTGNMVGGTGTLTVANSTPAPVKTNDVVMIEDCSKVATSVFQVTDYTAGTISHASVGSASTSAGPPGNQSNDLGTDYTIGATITPIHNVVYYVGTHVNGDPTTAGSSGSLWRRIGNNPIEELIEGVDALQIQYGVDTTGDRLADIYRTANQVTDWGQVVSVSIGLLIRSADEYGTEVDGTTYSVLGVNAGPFNDRRQRLIFTTTAALRNRAL